VTATRERESASSPYDLGEPAWSERSAFGTTRGVPWWAAVLLAGVPTMIGTLLDIVLWTKPGLFFTACYFVGCVLGVLLVKRQSLYGPMVQPPLVAGIAMPIVVLISGSGGGTSGAAKAFSVVSPLITGFPAMGITTVVVLAIGLVRMFVLQRADDEDADADAINRKPAPKPQAAQAGGRPKPAVGNRPPEAGERAAGRPARGEAGRPRPGAQPGRATDRQGGRARGQASGNARGGQGSTPQRGDRSVPPGRDGGQRGGRQQRQTPPGRGGKPPERRQGGGEPPRRPRRPPREDFWD
jgi:hypothetical protein